MTKNIEFFVKKYLENRPMFMAVIRSQEAMIFQKYMSFIESSFVKTSEAKRKVLDFGCSDGFFSGLVFGKNKIGVGMDLINNKRVEEARKEKIYKKITLYDGNIIPYHDNSFDTVISNSVLEHIPNLEFSLNEIYRILKPGGYLLTSVMTDQWEENLLGSKIFGKIYRKYMKKIQVHHNLLSNKRWRTHFQRAGFKIELNEEYLFEKSSSYLDLFHYLSVGSLISHKLFNKWVLFSIPFFNKMKIQFIKKIIIDEDNPNKASALFFVLKK